jgi:hypothetical protein
MKSRREFLQIGVAALALPISARGAFASSAVLGEPAATPLYKVVFDERFAASIAFSREVGALGAATHGIKGDITDLWFHDLYARWKQGPAAIAGLTGHGAIFCLERLAWDQGMRVVFRGEHKHLPGGQIEHALSGPESMVRRAARLEANGTEWASLMAGVVTRCPAGRSEVFQTTVSASAARHKSDPDELISWVIAPVRRA